MPSSSLVEVEVKLKVGVGLRLCLGLGLDLLFRSDWWVGGWRF